MEKGNMEKRNVEKENIQKENHDWKQDPRLRMMNPEKLKCLTEFADRIRSLPKEQVLPAFTALQLETARKGLAFSDQETELLVSVLSANMTPTERKRLETLRILAKKMAARFS